VAESKCIVKLCPASLQWKVGHCSIINGHPTNYDLSELCCGRCVSNCGVILQRSCFATQSAASVVAMSPGDSPVPNGARQVSQSQICWAKEKLLRNCNLPKTATQCDQNSLWVSCYQKKLCNVPLCVCWSSLCFGCLIVFYLSRNFNKASQIDVISSLNLVQRTMTCQRDKGIAPAGQAGSPPNISLVCLVTASAAHMATQTPKTASPCLSPAPVQHWLATDRTIAMTIQPAINARALFHLDTPKGGDGGFYMVV